MPRDEGITCECAPTYGSREYAGQIEYTDAFKCVLDIAWVGEDPLGRVTDLLDGYRVNVRLEYAVWGLVHLVVRA